MRFLRHTLPLAVIAFLCATASFAQSLVPTLAQPIPAQRLGALPTTLDLRNFFGVPGITGQIVQFTTTSGRLNVDLLANDAPKHVANFLTYVGSRAYDNTIFHHVNYVSNAPASIQGGVFTATLPLTQVTRNAPVPLEYKVPNTRGTLAAARGSDPDSATSEWFFNTQDNSAALAPSATGAGITVFGRVLGGNAGLGILDTLSQFPSYAFAGTPFTQIPLRNVSPGQTQLQVSNFVTVTSVRVVPLYAALPGETAVLSFSASRSNTTIVNVAVTGSTLTLSPLAVGTANVTVRATDTNGNFVDTTFSVTVTTPPLLTPLFTSQPSSQTIATGDTVVLDAVATGSPSFQWYRNGALLPGATSSTFVLRSASAAHAGTYTCVARNSVGSTTSAPATLSVVSLAPTLTGRLANLSILTTAGSGAKTLTIGAIVNRGDAGATLPLLVRAVGPTLDTAFGLSGVLLDPQLSVYRPGASTPFASNDDWGGTPTLSAAFGTTGAFSLPTFSLDSALLLPLSAGNYTMQVTGKGSSPGLAIAELYDAAGSARATSTPRLINISTLTQIDPGDSLTVGFVLTGQSSRTVLIRAVGPSLEPFGVGNLMADPRLELFNNATSQKIAENDNWGGDTQLSSIATSVGAFSLIGPATRDAVLLVTLAPGQYSARVNGGAGAGGSVIVEVYEVP